MLIPIVATPWSIAIATATVYSYKYFVIVTSLLKLLLAMTQLCKCLIIRNDWSKNVVVCHKSKYADILFHVLSYEEKWYQMPGPKNF